MMKNRRAMLIAAVLLSFGSLYHLKVWLLTPSTARFQIALGGIEALQAFFGFLIAVGLWTERAWAPWLGVICVGAAFLVSALRILILWRFMHAASGILSPYVLSAVALGIIFCLLYSCFSSKKSKILIGFYAVIMLTIGVLGAILFSKNISDAVQAPDTLATTGIKRGASLLTKKIVFKDPTLGPLSDLRAMSPSGFAIVGLNGADFVDPQFALQRQIRFQNTIGQVEMITPPGESPAFINRGGGWQAVSVFNADGTTRWGRTDAPDNMAAGDLSVHGAYAFVVGYNGGGGIELVDRDGVTQWKKPEANVWHVEIVRDRPSEPARILHTNATGMLIARSQEGVILSARELPIYTAFFSLCAGPTADAPPHLLIAGKNHVWLTTLKGDVTATFEAPGIGERGEARGSLLRTKAGKTLLVVLVMYSEWQKASLYLFDPTGALLYFEILSEPCRAITPTASTDWLVGCDHTVVRYSAGEL